MNPKTRIKVNRVMLIQALNDRKREEADRYAEEAAKYEKDQSSYPKLLADYLTDLAKRVRQGLIKPDEALDYRRRDEAPERPYAPQKPRSYDQAIAQLEMSTEIDIAISAEDFAAYIR